MHRSFLALPFALALAFGLSSAAQADTPTAIRSAASFSAKCIGLANNGSTANGTKLVLWDCHGGVDQSWFGRSDVSIRSFAGTNKCVGLANNGSTANGTSLVLWDCHGHNDQRWVLTPTFDGNHHYLIRNSKSGKCAGLANNGSTANGTSLVLWDCHQGADQRWVLPEPYNSGNSQFVYGFSR
ncbi:MULTISPECIES: RICIN domain-containing protein [unclassified Nonomuraea]|uniref:RICIN domain-containing protein n=1 Tax=unclassified Nonomuraea TaxID=2593643 RepID=UPI0033D78D45